MGSGPPRGFRQQSISQCRDLLVNREVEGTVVAFWSGIGYLTVMAVYHEGESD